MILAGMPATSVFGGTSWVTMAPAATTELSPIVTPLRTMTREPSQTLLPIRTGRGSDGSERSLGLSR